MAQRTDVTLDEEKKKKQKEANSQLKFHMRDRLIIVVKNQKKNQKTSKNIYISFPKFRAQYL